MRLTVPYSPKELDLDYYDYYGEMQLDGLKYNNLDDFKTGIIKDFIHTPRFSAFSTVTGTYGDTYSYDSNLGSYYGNGYASYNQPSSYAGTFRWPNPVWTTKVIPIPTKIQFTLSRTGGLTYGFKLDIYGTTSKSLSTIYEVKYYRQATPPNFTEKTWTYVNLKDQYLNAQDQYCILYWYCPANFYSNKHGGAFQAPLYIKKFSILFR